MPKLFSKTASNGWHASVSPGPHPRHSRFATTILRSEAATMGYLQRHTRIPTPKMFGWACESDPDNALGVGYILMEKLDGKALDWQAATPAQKEKIMQQLVDIFLEVEKHPFEAMGSLVSSSGDASGFSLQGLAHQATFRVRDGVHWARFPPPWKAHAPSSSRTSE